MFIKGFNEDATTFVVVEGQSVFGYMSLQTIGFKTGTDPVKEYVFVPSTAVSASNDHAVVFHLLVERAFAWRDARDPQHSIYHGAVCVPQINPDLDEMLERLEFVPGPDTSGDYLWRAFPDYNG
jgi:hypothetical protein